MTYTALYVAPLVPIAAVLGTALLLLFVPLLALLALAALLCGGIAALLLLLRVVVRSLPSLLGAFRRRLAIRREAVVGRGQSSAPRRGRERGLSGSSDQGSSSPVALGEESRGTV